MTKTINRRLVRLEHQFIPATESEFNRRLRLRLVAARARSARTPEPNAGVSFTASQGGSSHRLDLAERLGAGRRRVSEARLPQNA
jgi:hypothetical protein